MVEHAHYFTSAFHPPTNKESSQKKKEKESPPLPNSLLAYKLQLA